jgi:hypothetical protein
LIQELAPVAVIGIGAFIGWLLSNRELELVWRPLARALGLSVRRDGLFSSPVLEGTYRGIELRAQRLPKKKYEEAKVQLEVRIAGRLPPCLALRREPEGLDRLSGVRDIQVGVPELDHALQIQSLYPAGAIRLLRRPEMQGFLQAFFGKHPEAELSEEKLKVTYPLETPTEAVFRDWLDALVDDVQQLEQVLEARALEALAAPAAVTARPADAQSPQRSARVPASIPPGRIAAAPAASPRPFRRANPQIVAAYRRQNRGRLGWLAISALGFASLVYTVPHCISDTFGIPGLYLLYASFAAGVLGLFVPAINHRCPACGAFIGMLFSNRVRLTCRVCPHCNEPLSEDEERR